MRTDGHGVASARGGSLTPSVDLGDLRIQYEARGLDVADVAPDPMDQFDSWFGDVVAAELPEANAMVLATVDDTGAPSARAVLLKSYDALGFVLYTNLESAKGRHLASRPRAALTFLWQPLHRQVRVVGDTTLVDEDEASSYFASRPRDSQLSAWASPQSSPIGSRADLEDAIAEVAARFEGTTVPKPPYWGGIRVDPTELEFWQGQPNRHHDRVRYRRLESGWTIDRLAP